MILSFVVIAVLLVMIVVYFSASRAVIKIQPRPKLVETEFFVNVASDGGGENAVPGVLFDTEASGTGQGEATGTELLAGNAIGKVILINKRPEAQTLVKTTRLLSSDNILLRLLNRATIPANGQIEADVYADDPNAFTELAPTKFKIPGLWEGLQDKVYAESKAVLKSTGDSIKIVKAVDISKAKENLTEKIYNQAMAEFKNQLPNSNYVTLVVGKKVLEESATAEPGAKQDKFDAGMKLKVTLLGIDQNKVIEKAGGNLQSVLADGYDLLNIDPSKFIYQVQSFDEAKKTASVRVKVQGQSAIKADNEIFSKEKLSDLSPKAVELYLLNFEEIESVQVELSPFWVKKVPKMKDHISIVIVNPMQ